MDLQIVRLETLVQARALAHCVYEVYGLTFHRAWLYEPETTLGLNRKGHVTSFLAMKGEVCVGHMAAIRPHYEYTIAGEKVAADDVREVGLSMSLEPRAAHRIFGLLGSALFEWAGREGVRGMFSRCVTFTTASQRAARPFAVPTALMLGAIPFWVRYREHGVAHQREPISTVAYYGALRPSAPQEIYLPDMDLDLYEAIYDRIEEPRLLRTQREGIVVAPATDLRVHFDPSRHQGWIHVMRAGPDVERRVVERFRWLMGGQIRHVTLNAPLDNPFVARAVAAWKGEGMIFGGVLPNLRGVDVLVLQGLRQVDLRPEKIQLIDPLSARLRDRAVADWWAARDMEPASTRWRGTASPGPRV